MTVFGLYGRLAGVDFAGSSPYTPWPFGLEIIREADLSAEQARSQATSWISAAHDDCRWPTRARRSAQAGAQAPFRLNGSVQSAVSRLRHRSEFVRVARRGRSCVMPGLVLQVWRPDHQDHMQQPTAAIRLGITASRKVGNAVARNRARRRLREVARLVLPVSAAPGQDYVLVGRAATLQRPFAMLVDDLHAALRRLRAWRPASAARTEAMQEDGA